MQNAAASMEEDSVASASPLRESMLSPPSWHGTQGSDIGASAGLAIEFEPAPPPSQHTGLLSQPAEGDSTQSRDTQSPPSAAAAAANTGRRGRRKLLKSRPKAIAPASASASSAGHEDAGGGVAAARRRSSEERSPVSAGGRAGVRQLSKHSKRRSSLARSVTESDEPEQNPPPPPQVAAAPGESQLENSFSQLEDSVLDEGGAGAARTAHDAIDPRYIVDME